MNERPQWAALADLPGVEVVGYGINRPGRPALDGVPMLRAGDIGDGRIQTTDTVCVRREVAEAHPKTRLRPGDLLIVLAHTAVALADAHFAVLAADRKGWPERRFKDVVRDAWTGTVPRPSVPSGGR
ncbi:hypothetical protein [Streptomyces sp. NPDC102360]|uniref:hypothetical protein n=1 Tax=Streptomyces sp. NPDC102360 TaxID=3366160 RepID=UPI00382953E0